MTRTVWALATVCIIQLLTLALILFYVGYAIDRNNRILCGQYDIIYNAIKPNSIKNANDKKVAVEYRKEIGRTLVAYHCDKR